jgi:carbonic anhydrase/acetyltransferase-like protein (isoleucine patch superfamily)
VVEARALIGTGAIVLQRAHVGEQAMLAAGSVLGEGVRVGPRMLAAGVPAREKKELSGSALEWTETAAEHYQGYRRRYLKSSREV